MIKTLVLCDDYWHPGEVIEAGMKPLEDKLDISYIHDAKDMLTHELLEKYQVIVCCKGDQINGANQNIWFEENVTEVMPEDFGEWVSEGNGMLFIHAGNTYKKGSGFAKLAGSFFLGHPPRCTVELELIEHPITEGVNDFSIRDEHYQIEVTESNIDIFMKSISKEGGEQIAGYTKELGKGRICVLTPGHILDVWRKHEYLKLVYNAIEWSAGVR
ncbi:ThuA domain-containing protein [Bacteroides caecimuris]|uniref:ThuA domain-containing protein n=1 Tax=Bacteroides caecimuris TaxID=1796613 RepID=UPI0026F19C1D|nr:ThuA domain-containing protein [Bacteroides caecimuris]